MNNETKRQWLAARVELLRAHIEHVGQSPGFERALTETEAALREVEQRDSGQS